MELTKEQIEFLDRVCYGRKYWKLNSNGEVDVDGGVVMSGMNLTEIPVKFGSVKGGRFYCYNNQLTSLIGSPTSIEDGYFNCSSNQLTSLEGCPISIDDGWVYFYKNPLTNYFKNIKEEDFLHWDKLYWGDILRKYPFLINIAKKYIKDLKWYLERFPQTKLYLE